MSAGSNRKDAEAPVARTRADNRNDDDTPFVILVRGPIRRADAQISVERIVADLRLMLQQRFPGRAFEFVSGHRLKMEQPAAPLDQFAAVPILGSAGGEACALRQPPSDELRRQITEAIYAFRFPDDAWEPT